MFYIFLRIYSWLFFQNYKDDLKPNFHWCTHLSDQIRDYGPVYGFWSFTFERLNGVLKNYNTNNHSGGEIEVSFFRSYLRDNRVREIVSILFLIHK